VDLRFEQKHRSEAQTAWALFFAEAPLGSGRNRTCDRRPTAGLNQRFGRPDHGLGATTDVNLGNGPLNRMAGRQGEKHDEDL